MRRDFSLIEEDSDFLASLGLPWEAVRTSDGNWLIINDYPVPVGYNVSHVNVALKLDPGYPVSQIDMVYFSPDLYLLCGKLIGALSPLVMDGKIWQRWSRHRTGENPWRPGLDDLSTHFQMVNFWLEREINK